MGFNIKIKNDGKGTWQSWECEITSDEGNLYLFGYGSTEKEAKDECYRKLNKYIIELLEFRNKNF